MLKLNQPLRRDDGVIFHVIFLGHWSEIQNSDTGENDRVKWMGPDEFVGATSGHSYKIVK